MKYPVIVPLCLVALSATAAVAADAPDSAPLPNIADTREIAQVSIAELERRTSDGDAAAQAELGARYGRGAGVPKDYAKAIELLQAAAAKHDPDAQYYLGTAYAKGMGVTRNETQAALFFEMAADQGQPAAEFVMAEMISRGKAGFSRSWPAAIRYLWDSACKGYTPSQFMLGYAYQTGVGVDRNPRAAAYWYRRIDSRLHNLRAEYNLRVLLADGLVEREPGDPVEPPGPAEAAAESK